MGWLFVSGGQILEPQPQSFQPSTVSDFQESTPVPQFNGINSLVLCLLYGPALTTICDSWKDHSFNYTDICWQSDTFVGKVMSLPFNTLSRFVIAFLPITN